ncbi:hypothetical protein ACRALDRAFT_1062021 [Sodiomyces alcalophilus JCM 7366]|uniref:uncharacterized protein n=1 Tax=Sodiomyces alcalophilus JCM 7366 TaxID=591952 RepID=UPI0039B4D200
MAPKSRALGSVVVEATGRTTDATSSSKITITATHHFPFRVLGRERVQDLTIGTVLLGIVW